MAAAALCPVFARMCDFADINAGFRAWLLSQRVLKAGDFSMIVHDASCIQKEVIDVCIASEPPVAFANAMERIAVKKLYAACVAAAAAVGTTALDASLNPGEAEVPPATVIDLKALWSTQHGFVLLDAHLLIPMLQGKLW